MDASSPFTRGSHEGRVAAPMHVQICEDCVMRATQHRSGLLQATGCTCPHEPMAAINLAKVDTRVPRVLRVMLSMCLAAGSWAADAQDIEPRTYSNAPVGVNFLIAGYAYTRGGLSLDPALPVSAVHL